MASWWSTPSKYLMATANASLFDLFHNYGEDVQASPTGDLARATGSALTEQYVGRFLLTNPGDDPFNPTWGLGIAKYIGSPQAAAQIQALILKGMRTINVVDQTQSITANVSGDDLGNLSAFIQYTDATTGIPVNQTLPLQ